MEIETEMSGRTAAAPSRAPRRGLLDRVVIPLGIAACVGYTLLSLTPHVSPRAVPSALIGPLLWLWRVVREGRRLVDGLSSLRRLLVFTALLVAITVTQFAVVYDAMRRSFAGMTTRLAPLYFSVSTFTTTGYGDIHPVRTLAQLATMIQMTIDWIETTVVIGLILALVTQALGDRITNRAQRTT